METEWGWAWAGCMEVEWGWEDMEWGWAVGCMDKECMEGVCRMDKIKVDSYKKCKCSFTSFVKLLKWLK